jgi:hypothetical protein
MFISITVSEEIQKVASYMSRFLSGITLVGIAHKAIIVTSISAIEGIMIGILDMCIAIIII